MQRLWHSGVNATWCCCWCWALLLLLVQEGIWQRLGASAHEKNQGVCSVLQSSTDAVK